MVSLQAYTTEQMYEALMKYAIYQNIDRVAKEVSIPRNTILNWIEDEDNKKYVEEYRAKNLLDFEEKSAGIIEKMLNLMEKKVDKALKGEEECRITELTGAIGMLYEKRNDQKGGNKGNVVNISIKLTGDGLPESVLTDV